MCLSKRSQRGFTLIELMVVVAIIGILAKIAYPNYVESVRKAKRADAKAVLTQAAQLLERNYSLTQKYSGVTLPSTLAAKSYTIGFDVQTDTTFRLRAVPDDDPTCGTLTLDNTGLKLPATSGCW